MRSVWSIFKFVFIDNVRSIWAMAYMVFIALCTFTLIFFTGSFTRSLVSIMNIVILIAPLVSTMMTAMYYFNKTDLMYLLLSQPVKRSHAFLGMYLGIALNLALALALGMLIGMLASSGAVEDFQILLLLVAIGVLLSLVFSAIAFMICVSSRDKLKGIGLALFAWLFAAVIYDGLMLVYFIVFNEYPIEKHAIVLSLFNPIDLSRVFVMLQLDISALMGYSGAIFNKFFGSNVGTLISLSAILVWIVGPMLIALSAGRKKGLLGMPDRDIHSNADIQVLVDTFYASVRQDELLGPIFNERIGERWPQHLEIMYRFWQSLIFSDGSYAGNPFLKHATLPIAAVHFDRWLRLFTDTVDKLFIGTLAEEAKLRAGRIAIIFRSKMAQTGTDAEVS